jgi:hypothetical protein
MSISYTCLLRPPIGQLFTLDRTCDKVCQWLATGGWFSPVSSTNNTDCHDIITENIVENDVKHHKPKPKSYPRSILNTKKLKPVIPFQRLSAMLENFQNNLKQCLLNLANEKKNVSIGHR